MGNLSTKEIVVNYFENDLQEDRIDVNDPEVVKAIREYMDEKGIVDLKSVDRLIVANPSEDEGIRDVIEYAFKKLYERSIDTYCEETIRIRNYFTAIENLISNNDYSNVIADLDRLRGEHHLAFVIDLMNRRFSDPETALKYKFMLYLCISDPVIGKLFFKYVLGNEIQRDVVKLGAVNVRLEEDFLYNLCFVAIEKMCRYNVNFDNIPESLDFATELTNVLEIIIRKGYYKESGNSKDIKGFLKVYIVFGIREELEKYIINADEILLRMMISSWSYLIMTTSRDIMFPRYIISIIEFLRNFQVDRLPCCKKEWRNMINFIRQKKSLSC